MDLSLSDKHRALQDEVRAFIREHGHKSPKLGGGRKRPDQKALDWQKLLVDHGYVARTIPREYGGCGAEPDVLEAAVIAAEFAAAGVYAGLTNQGISMLVPTLLEVGTEEQKRAVGREDHPRRRDLVPGLFGAGLRQRSRVADHARRAAGRTFRGQRPEDLDQFGALRRHDVPAVPHRAGQAEARRHLLPAAVDADARHRGASAAHDDRPRRIQRGVLHRCARARGPDRAGPRQGLVCRQRDAEARALDDRQCREDDDAAGTAHRAAEVERICSAWRSTATGC